jgi:DNA-directed RNA polymerase subunit RPC12/RpoP
MGRRAGNPQGGMGIGTPRGMGQGGGKRSVDLGPSGDYVCPSCGTKVSHQAGNPCYQVSCPKCGAKMMKE